MEILFRLMKDDEVVGWELHKFGGIYHLKNINDGFGSINDLRVSTLNYIPHDRKDMYTGIKVREQRLFEGDVVDYFGSERVVKWHFNRWVLYAKEGGGGKPNMLEFRKCELRHSIKITGIKEGR